MNENYYSKLSNIISNLSPLEFIISATLIGYFISLSIPITELNSLGNWFEQVGQIMLTYSAQGTATPTNEQYNQLVKDVEDLKRILSKKIN